MLINDRTYTLAIIICWLGISHVQPFLYAQSPYAVTHWNTENGLEANGMNNLFQDEEGYIWVGGYTGLYQFDGKEFQKISYSLPGISFGYQRDAKGRIWLQTVSGMYLISKKRTIRVLEADLDLIFLAHFPDGRILVSRDISLIEREAKPLRKKKEFNKKIEYGKKPLLGIVEGNQLTHFPRKWAGWVIEVFSDSSFFVGNEKGLFLVESPEKRTLILPDAVFDIAISDSQEVAIFSRSGIYFWKEGEVFRHPVSDQLNLKDFSLSTLRINFKLAWEKELLVLAMPSQVVTLNTADKDTVPIFHELEGIRPVEVFIDKDQSIWVSTTARGLYRLEKKIFTSFSTVEGHALPSISSLHETPDSNIWVGAYCTGSYLLDNGQIESLNTDYCTFCRVNDSTGGTYYADQYGLNHVSPQGSAHFFDEKMVWHKLYSMHLEEEGSLLLGTENDVFRYREQKLYPAYSDIGKVHRIAKGAEGTLFFCTTQGLYARDSAGEFSYLTEFAQSPPLDVRYVHEYPVGTYWIITYNRGLWVWREDVLQPVPKSVLEVGDALSAMLEDSAGNFWLSSNTGIYVFLGADLVSWLDGSSQQVPRICLGRQAGMKSIECNGGVQESAIMDHKGDLWFPTVEG